MKSVIFATLGAIFYGLSAAILEQKLQKVSPLIIMIEYGSIVSILSLIILKITNPAIIISNTTITQENIFYIIIIGIVIFTADIFTISAYSKGNAITITSLLTLTPVATMLFKNIWQ
jgi:drug/metabolite transporter (DMT)-like permease